MNPEIIVATPGRLWELASNDERLMANLRQIKYLVLDEADRMLESGHFKDLDEILKAISYKRKESYNQWIVEDNDESEKDDGDEEMGELEALIQQEAKNKKKRVQECVVKNKRITYLFSATLLPDFEKMRDNGKRRKPQKKTKKNKQAAGFKVNTEDGEDAPTIGIRYFFFIKVILG